LLIKNAVEKQLPYQELSRASRAGQLACAVIPVLNEVAAEILGHTAGNLSLQTECYML